MELFEPDDPPSEAELPLTGHTVGPATTEVDPAAAPDATPATAAGSGGAAGEATAFDPNDPLAEAERPVRPPRKEPPAPETVRANLAYLLCGLLALLTVGLTAAAVFGAAPVDDVKAIAEIVLPPIVALAGTVTGFYFASVR